MLREMRGGTSTISQRERCGSAEGDQPESGYNWNMSSRISLPAEGVTILGLPLWRSRCDVYHFRRSSPHYAAFIELCDPSILLLELRL
jgi:hypothetical protein